MADEYPWGKETASKRVSKLEASLKSIEKRRDDLVASHKAKMAEIEETEKTLRADLKTASTILEKERRDKDMSSATKMFERLVGNSSVDLEKLLKSGKLEKSLSKLLEAADESSGPAETKVEPKAAKPTQQEPIAKDPQAPVAPENGAS